MKNLNFSTPETSQNPATPLSPSQRRARRSLRLAMFESAITEGLISMSIMTLFYTQSLGMSQAEIALSQAIFTVVVMVLNLPLGWVADRFSRKWANIIGDLGAALGFLLYSQAQSFAHVVICEILLGAAMAFSQGVDQALFATFCLSN